MKQILVPTDFSTNARRAAEYAIQLFRDEPCVFILLNTFGADSYTTSNLMVLEAGNPAYDKAYNESLEMLKELSQELEADKINENHSFETVSTYNFLTEAIKDIISQRDIHMVIMGTKGATGAKEVWFGSNAVSVMENLENCPVLAVPETAEIKLPREIVFPTSFKFPFKSKELDVFLQLASKLGCVVRVMHVSQHDDLTSEQLSNKKALLEGLSDISTSSHTLTNIEPETAIRCFVESRDIDMIAMVHKKQGFFSSIFKKPVIKGVGYHTRVPLLVMHRS